MFQGISVALENDFHVLLYSRGPKPIIFWGVGGGALDRRRDVMSTAGANL